jgi:hypothetical protein
VLLFYQKKRDGAFECGGICFSLSHFPDAADGRNAGGLGAGAAAMASAAAPGMFLVCFGRVDFDKSLLSQVFVFFVLFLPIFFDWICC